MLKLPLIECLSNSFISIPSNVIVPLLTLLTADIKLNIVDLPAPDEPTNATVSLALILKLRSFNIFFFFYPKDTFLNSKLPLIVSKCLFPNDSFLKSPSPIISLIL